MDQKIVKIIDRYSDSPYYSVVTSSEREVEQLKTRAELAGLLVQVRRADTFDTAMKFLRQL